MRDLLDWLSHAPAGSSAPWQWIGLVLAAPLSYGVAVGPTRVVSAIARHALGTSGTARGSILLEAVARPLRILLASILFRYAAMSLGMTPGVWSAIAQATFALVVFAVVWFTVRTLRVAAEWMSEHIRAAPDDEIRHRVFRTHLTLMRQMSTAVIVVVGSGAALMQFTLVRTLGLSLLASAGLAGIVLGFAAQKPLASLMGGIQLSITQPIRIGDSVFIERELGTVEKIHLTYVVVRLREQRVLVVPVSRFLDTPFENWTLAKPDVIGAVLLSVDFSTPVDAIRAEVRRACVDHEGWDHETCSLEVVDTTERTMTLRALMSSSDASKNWSLRCFVRERLIAFLGVLDGGCHLPHDRADPRAPAPGEPPEEVSANELSELGSLENS